MKKFKILLFMMLLGIVAQAQTPYVDVLVAPAMMAYSSTLKNQQEKTNEEISDLKAVQGWVSGQMVIANDLQQKLYKGLKEVNGTLQNGLQVQRIYKTLVQIEKSCDAIYNEASANPEYTIFATSATKTAVTKIIDVGTDVSELLNESDINLATAGDRRRLLGNIELNLKTLNVYLINIKLTMKRAKRKGWWNSINPFNSYVNTDKMLFNQIVRNSERLQNW